MSDYSSSFKIQLCLFSEVSLNHTCFPSLVESLRALLWELYIPVCVLKEKKKKKRREGKKKEKKVGGIKDCVQGSRSSFEAGSPRLQIVALNH